MNDVDKDHFSPIFNRRAKTKRSETESNGSAPVGNKLVVNGKQYNVKENDRPQILKSFESNQLGEVSPHNVVVKISAEDASRDYKDSVKFDNYLKGWHVLPRF